MDKIFINNLYNLRQANIAVIVVGFCFTLFPLLIENNFFKAGVQLVLVVVAALLCIFVSHKISQHKQGRHINKRLIYTQIILYYANIILFGIYLGIFANPEKLAVSFMGILICALCLFNISPLFSLYSTLGAISLFIAASIFIKTPGNYSFDIVNVLFAGCVAQFFGWKITMFRMSLASSAGKLEEERNRYYGQSLLDELTQLKNRRDFMQTFQRFLSNYRQSDNFLCIAMIDIDFFKNYNDYYGHAKGDECLCAVGKALKDLNERMGIYAARVGGEEFALIWFEKEVANVGNVTSEISQMISNLNIHHERSNIASNITVSIGVQVVQCGSHYDLHTLYDLADKALYTAKRNGRNQIVINSSLSIA
ncbi:MAG: GGDEF domain-containing protein [Spirochaetaceae bacterium]|nr:GGDEF domain-containing protein [Spirochaetaceae bacterium]